MSHWIRGYVHQQFIQFNCGIYIMNEWNINLKFYDSKECEKILVFFFNKLMYDIVLYLLDISSVS